MCMYSCTNLPRKHTLGGASCACTHAQISPVILVWSLMHMYSCANLPKNLLHNPEWSLMHMYSCANLPKNFFHNPVQISPSFNERTLLKEISIDHQILRLPLDAISFHSMLVSCQLPPRENSFTRHNPCHHQ
jgi:hypothetical protein